MTASATPGADTPAYLDPSLSPEERAVDLVSRFTLAEKVGQMMHDAPAIERLGVPNYNWWNECLHGVARAGIATVFPQAIGLAATWNDDLLFRIATSISDEGRAKHHQRVREGVRQIYTGLTFWSPNVNIFRDPRWGRGQETYGEDPHLTSRLGVAFVRGIQGDDPRLYKAIATAKHYAVHSGPESTRHSFDARPSDYDLRHTYLPAFDALVREARVASVMGAYNRVNGEPCNASPTLLRKILRDEWGFDGYVVSDCWAIDDVFGGHAVSEGAAEAAALAVKAGCDLECGCAFAALTEAVGEGLIAESDLDQALARLFAARFRLGLFDPPEAVPWAATPVAVVDAPAHRALARQTARESIVLLRNQGELLPLRRDLRSIAVIGPNADDRSVLLGNYNGTPSRAVTPLEGIRRAVSPRTAIYNARGCDLGPGFPTLVTIPAEHLRPVNAEPGERGLTAERYGNATFDRAPTATYTDPRVEHVWNGRADTFSVRWTGFLVPPTSGVYRLGVDGFSHYRLWLDGQPVAGFDGIHHAITRTADIALEAGRLYPLRLEYANTGVDPQVRFLWAPPESGDPIAEAVAVAERAEAIVAVLGLAPTLEGEEMPVDVPGFVGGDRTDIELPATQRELLRRLVALGKPLVLVLLSGSAIGLRYASEHVPAILAAWYPGEEGGSALADVLFGDYSPAGRLPVTFHESVDDLPAFDDYAMAGRTYRYYRGRPLYPFGHGLSYTCFAYANLTVAVEGDAARVSFDLANLGDRAGDEVAQVYARDPQAGPDGPAPLKELVGFRRLALSPGETRRVELDVPLSRLAAVGVGDAARRVELMVGASSEDVRLNATVNV